MNMINDNRIDTGDDNMKQTHELCTLFNQTLAHDLAVSRSNIGSVISVVDISAGSSRCMKNKVGGGKGGKEVVDVALHTIINKLPKVTKVKDMDLLEEKMTAFQSHIQDVIDEIQRITDSTQGIDQMSEVREKYEKFSRHLDTILESKGYRFIEDTGLKVLVNEDTKEPRMWGTLFNVWLPFVTNVSQIIKSLENDDAIATYQVINDQLYTIRNTMDMFEQIVDELNKKFDQILQKPRMKTYDSYTPSTPSTIVLAEEVPQIIHYVCRIPGLPDETGTVVLTEEKIHNFMKNIELSSSDAFSLIETKKMQFIDQYVQKFNKSNKSSGFLSAVGLETDESKNIFNTKLLEKFNKLVNFKSPDQDQILGGGKVVVGKDIIGYDVSDLSQMLLTLTQRMSLINIKLKEFKQKIREHEFMQKQIKFYVFYLMNIASLRGVKRLNMYCYINRNILDFYRNIINDIDSRRKREGMSIDALYFDKYHNFTIERMKTFLTFLVNNMKTDTLIDVSKCTGPVVSDFIVFNHFKDILDRR